MPADTAELVCAPCNKRVYRSWAFALRVLLRMSARDGTAMRIYQCPHRAGTFHLTRRRLR